MRLLSWAVYLPLQIAFIPLAVLGAGIVTYRQLFVSSRLGVSATGIEVIGGRWTMDVFGMREDEPTARLIRALPNASTLGLWLVLLPLWIEYRLSGTYFLYPRLPAEGRETLAELVVGRTLHFDRIIERIAPRVEQFVLLGAGYDTRAYGTLRRDDLRFFELDRGATQRLKLDALDQAGIDRSHVTFVTVDFNREDASDRLGEAGYDATKRTLFLWEGVTMYLDEEDVRSTLRNVRVHAAPESVLAADFFAQRMIDYASKPYNRKALEYTDEAVSFGLPFETGHEEVLERFVAAEGFRLGETYFMGASSENGPFMVVAELRV